MRIRMRYFVLSLIAAMVVGGAVTGGVMYRLGPSVIPSDLAKAQQVYNIIQQDYYVPVDKQKAEAGAINGMLASLDDPYTSFLTPDETKAFQQSISAKFEGIGAQIREENGHIIIDSPIHGAPAEKAGLKPNDIILEVDGLSLEGMKVEEAVTHIRGPKGTVAKLKIQRPGTEAPFDVAVTRDTIPLETVFSKLLDDKSALIQVTSVSEPTADELGKAIQQMKAQGAKGIILDLRGNPGGLVNVAEKVAEYFVPKGKPILGEQARDGKVVQYLSKGHASDLPVVVLVDKGSASAAEIIAGALRESAGIPLIGETTFGKGVMQTTVDMGDGSLLKYTIAQWLTPEGHQIHKQGLKPDVEVKLPDYADLLVPHVDKEYKQGDSGPAVQTVQKMLKAVGFDPGRDDGFLDAPTVAALTQFQSKNGLPATGTLKDNTVTKLVELLRQKIQANDTQLAKAQEVLQGLIQKH